MYLMTLNPAHIKRLIQYKADNPTSDGSPSIALSMIVFAPVADTVMMVLQAKASKGLLSDSSGGRFAYNSTIDYLKCAEI